MPRITAVFPKDYEIIGGESVKLEVHFENGGGSKGNAVTMEYYDKTEERWITITPSPLGQRDLDAKTFYAVYRNTAVIRGIKTTPSIPRLFSDSFPASSTAITQ